MSAAISRVAMWLAALEVGDWPRLLSLHHPQALVIAGPQVLPAKAVDPDVYAMVQSTVANARPQPAWQLRSATEHAVGDGVVVLAVLDDGNGGRDVAAGFALGSSGDVLAMVADPAGPDSVLTESLADLSQLPPPARWQDGHLTALHHSLARRRQGLPGEIRALPEARFTCQGRGDCCHLQHWRIQINDNQWQAIAAWRAASAEPIILAGDVPAVRMGDPLCNDDRHPLGARQDGYCHQRAADGTCHLHAALGWQPVTPCQLYPVRPIRTPDGFDVTALFSCRTVCENQGRPLADQDSDLRRRLWPVQHRMDRIGDTVPLTRDGDERLPWSEYKTLETLLLADLARLPDASGLTAGSRRLANVLGRHAAGEPVTPDALLAPLWQDPQAASQRSPWLGGGGEAAWRDPAWRSVAFDRNDLLARYLRTVLFRKTGLADIGVAFPWCLTLIAFHLISADARYRAAKAGRGRTNEADLMAAVQTVEALLAHGDFPLRLAQLPRAPFAAPAAWAALVRESAVP